jgi:hypothetical protein
MIVYFEYILAFALQLKKSTPNVTAARATVFENNRPAGLAATWTTSTGV